MISTTMISLDGMCSLSPHGSDQSLEGKEELYVAVL